jgi:hypothetical protein
LTYAQGKNLETCAYPHHCAQPAVVERAFYEDDHDDDPVVLGFCLAHEESEL